MATGGGLLEFSETVEKIKHFTVSDGLTESANEQTKLGEFYPKRNDTKKRARTFLVCGGTCAQRQKYQDKPRHRLFQNGQQNKASEIWNEVLKSEELGADDISEYLQTLQKMGLANEARETSFKIVVRKLKSFDYVGDDREQEMCRLFRIISASFNDKAAKLIYL